MCIRDSLKILERGCKTLVGTFQKNTSFGFVLPDDRHYDKDIFISKKHINGAKDGDKVVVRLTDFGGAVSYTHLDVYKRQK